ncbi:hypothetical protein TSAR_003726 [Trichomalopsis sarcophagae]|uniref:Peptidase M13 N-terminal domain-containing protein n=1 Tax=Trichomalopsis sarcophagae TaxID=543379 RepID=A0A232EJH2_9HYME|nr:hypothetical protein TSAR_003726 [Trichomalopsis sarcophagae]
MFILKMVIVQCTNDDLDSKSKNVCGKTESGTAVLEERVNTDNPRLFGLISEGESVINANMLAHGFGHETVQLYYNYTMKVAQLLGADKQRAALELREVIYFERRLALVADPICVSRHTAATNIQSLLANLHEIVHALDTDMYIFDETGSIKQWYTDKSANEYINRTECYVQQYERYVDQQTGLTLDGLRRLTIKLDNHSPDDIRVLGMMSNSHEFAKSFNCPLDSLKLELNDTNVNILVHSSLKPLIISSYRLLGIILCLSILAINFTESNEIDSAKICTTPGCFSAANLIKGNIDQTNLPCHDFYKFACGGFINKSVIPMNRQSVGHLDSVREKVLTEVRQLVNKKFKPKEPRIFKLVKNYFRACKRETTEAKNNSLKALVGYIDQLGGWPVIAGDSWDAGKFDVFKTDYKLREIGYRPKSILNLYVFNDLFNTSRNFLYVGPPQAEIKSEIFKRGFMNEVVQAYYNYMVDIAVILGADRVRATRDLRKALDLERDITFVSIIIRISVETELASSFPSIASAINLRRLEDLEKDAAFVPWIEYINAITSPVVSFELFEAVNVPDLGYLKSLDYFLRKTPKKVMANYMIWKMIAESAIYLTDEIRERTFEYQRIKSQTAVPKPRKPRWQECIELLTDRDRGLMVGVSSMYVRKHFSEDTKEDVKEIVTYVVDGFKDILENVTWMDAATKIAASRKNEFMKQIIAYPNELLNNKTLASYAKNLDVRPNNHFQNYLNLQRFHFNFELTGIGNLSNNSLWTIFADSTVVNAYYYAADNAIGKSAILKINFPNSLRPAAVLLAALLQPPLFDVSWPSFAKYGSIGFMIAHEIMHAYDARRYLYDETGSLNPWMEKHSREEFKNRIQCFEDQYSNFTDKDSGIHVDGSLTVNENLADNGGALIAYHAYEKWTESHGQEAGLPGLDYNATQLFWISAMSFLCSRDTPQHLQDSLKSSEHTPDKFRAMGISLNSLHFSKAFNCPAGSPMNPLNKCKLW